MKHHTKCLLFFVIMTFIPMSSAYAATYTSEKCIKCHSKTRNKALQEPYIHRPFLNAQCLVCHLQDANTANKPGETHPKGSNHKAINQITWFKKHYIPSKTHFFLISASRINGPLFVKFKDSRGQIQMRSFRLPPLTQLAVRPGKTKNPTILRHFFHGVKRGILNSATISWDTDKPTTGQILYGLNGLTKKSDKDLQYRKHHSISLAPVILGNTYQYSLLSEDIYGNQILTPPSTFSTAKTGSFTEPQRSEDIEQLPLTDEFSRALWSIGKQYFIRINTNKETMLAVGYDKTLPPARSRSLGAKNQPPENHVALKRDIALNITVCLNCHTEYQTQYSHPINVGPKQGMTFPKEYPLLANGKMHCMTCHDYHASKNAARIRKHTKQELCVGCHKSYG